MAKRALSIRQIWTRFPLAQTSQKCNKRQFLRAGLDKFDADKV
jgi:hypothetical protein